MALKWSTVRREHVAQACELLLKGEHKPRTQAKDIFLVFRDKRLPAKHVLRLAYCVANNLAFETDLKFSSGEGVVKRLQDLGFTVERTPQ